jgi:hypothetical protein
MVSGVGGASLIIHGLCAVTDGVFLGLMCIFGNVSSFNPLKNRSVNQESDKHCLLIDSAM